MLSPVSSQERLLVQVVGVNSFPQCIASPHLCRPKSNALTPFIQLLVTPWLCLKLAHNMRHVGLSTVLWAVKGQCAEKPPPTTNNNNNNNDTGINTKIKCQGQNKQALSLSHIHTHYLSLVLLSLSIAPFLSFSLLSPTLSLSPLHSLLFLLVPIHLQTPGSQLGLWLEPWRPPEMPSMSTQPRAQGASAVPSRATFPLDDVQYNALGL